MDLLITIRSETQYYNRSWTIQKSRFTNYSN